jgi:hypothetical protein
MARIIPRIILLPGGLLGRVLEGFVGGVLEAIWGDSWRVPICCKIVVKINI